MFPDVSKEHAAIFFRDKVAKQNAALVNSWRSLSYILPKHWETLTQWYILYPRRHEPSIKLLWKPQILQIFINQHDSTQKQPMDVSTIC